MTTENNEMMSEGTAELSVDELEDAAGGYILDRGWDIWDSFRYVAVDDETGESYTYCNTHKGAKEIAEYRKVSTEVITQAQYKDLFGKEHI